MQAQLFAVGRHLSTGNVFLDAIITALIMWAWTHMTWLSDVISKKIDQFAPQKSTLMFTTETYVDKYGNVSNFASDTVRALMWYASNHAYSKEQREIYVGPCSTVRTSNMFDFVVNDTKYVKLGDQMEIRCEFSDCMAADKKDSLQSRKTCKIFLRSSTLSVHQLRTTVKKISIDHTRTLQTELDKPQLFYYCGSDCGDPRWIQAPWTSTTTLDDVHFDGDEDIKINLRLFVSNADFRALHSKLAYCFYGPPGSGKTRVMQAIANFRRSHVMVIHLNNVTDDEELRRIFVTRKINGIDIKHMPVTYMIDDVDAHGVTGVFTARTEESPSIVTPVTAIAGTSNTTLKIPPKFNIATMLSVLDGPGDYLCNQVFLMATNCLETIDPAFLRHGRCQKVFLGLPSRETVAKIFTRVYRREPTQYEQMPHKSVSVARVYSVMAKYLNNPDAALKELNEEEISHY